MERDQISGAGLWAAIVFAVLFAAVGLVEPAIPGTSDTVADAKSYFADNRSSIVAATYLIIAGSVPFVVFFAILKRRIAAVCDWLADTVFGGAILLAALTTTTTLIYSGVSLYGSQVDPGTARTAVGIIAMYPPLATGAVFLLSAGTALASLRFGALPRWAGWVSAAYALYEVVETATICSNHGIFEPTAGAINQIGTFGFLVWAIVVGAGLRSGPAPSASA